MRWAHECVFYAAACTDPLRGRLPDGRPPAAGQKTATDICPDGGAPEQRCGVAAGFVSAGGPPAAADLV